jgi:hypothetical protein
MSQGIKTSVIGLFVLFYVWAVYTSTVLLDTNKSIRTLKENYAEINRVDYGLFNTVAWKEKAFSVFTTHLDNFNVSPGAIDQVEKEFRVYLLDIYQSKIASGKLFDKTLADAEKEGKVNKFMLQLFRDNIKSQIEALHIKEHIPDMARQLAREIKKKEPQFREIMQKELQSVLKYEEKYPYTDSRTAIYAEYNCTDLSCTNKVIDNRLTGLQVKQKGDSQFMFLTILGLVILITAAYQYIGSRLWVLLATIVSILLLITGIILPMIILDVRLNSFTFNLFETDLHFDEQVIFYQNKSILDVAQNLLDSRGWDLKTVGVLVLCFSVVFPIIKLILSAGYLYIHRLQNTKLVQNIIYHLGKWSMADVFVIALFMTYIGFYGLINNQLEQIKHNQSGFAVETVNYTSLAPGALFFTSYCILSIMLGVVINRVTADKDNSTR